MTSRTPLRAWLDAVHVTLLNAPTDRLKSLENDLIIQSAAQDPEGAAETWGQLPEHRIVPPLETLRPPGRL